MLRTTTEPSIDANEAADLLRRWRAGDAASFNRLYELTYPTLRRKARLLRPANGSPTASVTDAVNGTYLQLLGAHVEQNICTLDDFYGYWAVAVRRFALQRCRRVGRRMQVSEEKVPEFNPNRYRYEETFVRLHESLEELRKLDPEAAEAVDLKYISGRTTHEIALQTGVAEPTITRRLSRARRFLAAQ